MPGPTRRSNPQAPAAARRLQPDSTGYWLQPQLYPVDFHLPSQTLVVARSRREDFADSLLVRAEDFPLRRLLALNMAEALKGLRGLQPQRSLRYLFHMPFCGNTLLSRHLDASFFVLRDPACLYALHVRVEAAQPWPKPLAAWRTALLALLSQPSPYGNTLVRVAGSYPHMIGPLVRSRSFAGGLYLYARPEVYMAQVLKQAKRRSDARALLLRVPPAQRSWCRRGRLLAPQSDAEVAAAAWWHSAQCALGAMANQRRQPLYTLQAEGVWAAPQAAARQACAALGQPYTALSAASRRELGEVHVKTGATVSARELAREREQARQALREDIAQGLRYLDRLDPHQRVLQALEARQCPPT